MLPLNPSIRGPAQVTVQGFAVHFRVERLRVNVFDLPTPGVYMFPMPYHPRKVVVCPHDGLIFYGFHVGKYTSPMDCLGIWCPPVMSPFKHHQKKTGGWRSFSFQPLKVNVYNLIKTRGHISKPLQRQEMFLDMGVSKNSGTPKWMVYNGKPYQNGWFGGTPIFRNIRMNLIIISEPFPPHFCSIDFWLRVGLFPRKERFSQSS